LDRGVINPQKGHILCEAKPGAAGVIDANSFETEAVMEASRLRKRSRNRRRARSISDPPSFFLPKDVRFAASEALLRKFSLFSISAKLDDDTPVLIILSKIAHTARKYRPRHSGNRAISFGKPNLMNRRDSLRRTIP